MKSKCCDTFYFGAFTPWSPALQYRPIISLCSSPITLLAKWVAAILSPFVGSFSQAHISNSKDFISNINDFYVNNPDMISKPMFSLDVKQLFTNVPVLTVLDFLHNKFVEKGLSLPNGMDIDTLIELIKLCCKNTVFSFNSKFYEQTGGCPMGSPLSVILANLTMEFIEVDLMILFPATPAFYKRYVNDTFGI